MNYTILEGLLRELQLNFKNHEGGELLVPFHAENYKNQRNENTILIVIKIIDHNEDETYIKFFSPLAFKISELHNNFAVLKSLFLLSWRIPMLKFNFDSKDGEIRPTIDYPVFDRVITQKELQCCLTRIAGLLDEIYDPIIHAIEQKKVHPDLNKFLDPTPLLIMEGSATVQPPSTVKSREKAEESIEEIQKLLTQIDKATIDIPVKPEKKSLPASYPTALHRAKDEDLDDDLDWI